MITDKYKTSDYKKNDDLEYLLGKINSILKDSKINFSSGQVENKYPSMFILGCPRSGTTLLTQWLASLNLFCYPTNFISRFYEFPYFGALIQEMLFNPNYRYKDELLLSSDAESFKSDVGKTNGVHEPHEFWYFWRTYFDFPEIPISLEEFSSTADFKGFQKQISILQNFYSKPIFMKSLIINWYIESIFKNINKPIFIYIKRDPIENIISILKIREKYYGNESYWFSFKPREYECFAKEDNYVQVAGQVYFTNREIEKSLKNLPRENKIIVDYKNFCSNPKNTFDDLKLTLYQNDYKIKKMPEQILNFKASSYKKNHEFRRIQDAYKYVQTII